MDYGVWVLQWAGWFVVVIVVCLILTVLYVCLQCEIVAFPSYTHLLLGCLSGQGVLGCVNRLGGLAYMWTWCFFTFPWTSWYGVF